MALRLATKGFSRPMSNMMLNQIPFGINTKRDSSVLANNGNIKLPVNLIKSGGIKTSTFSTHTVGRKPTIAEASACPQYFYEMSNDQIINLCAEGNNEALGERLIRDIMAVDNISWDEANVIFQEMSEKNTSQSFITTIPYKVGLATALTGAFASIPLCFDLQTVQWFNEHYVTTDVPPPEDLETWLEVGSWAWNWMEPPLGQVSFFLLALQFARSQMENLGIKPYTGWVRSTRAARLVSLYPKYNESVVTDFSLSQDLLP